MSSEIAIHVQDLSKRYEIYDHPKDRLLQMLFRNKKQLYREFWALKNISFTIGRGETVGIIGRNGSGKSTLLQLLCGTSSATTGTISTSGRVAALLELGAGFNPEFSGLDNILLNGAILGIPQRELENRIDDIIAFSELKDFIHQPVKTYSSGMQARLGFSVAINVDPEILIIDEALAVGDARFVAKCMRRIKDIQALGATVLFVSHDVSAVRTLCDRAIWINQGHLVEDGDVFPVTARFTEYMFDDSDLVINNKHSCSKRADSSKFTEIQNNKITSNDANLAPSDHQPIVQWGTNPGIIKSAKIISLTQNQQVDLLSYDEEVEIAVELEIPNDIPKDNLALAISIKDLKGTDLIVSTTNDFEVTPLPSGRNITIRFKFKNPLTAGKYLLVTAIERRTNLDVHYLEYIEGIRYFTSINESKIFGLFQPKITREITVNA